MTAGSYMFKLAEELWPIGRSLSGPGVRATLSILSRELPGLELGQFHSGERAFDWVIPREWSVEEAWLIAPDGSIVCDYKENNVSLLGYSVPVFQELELGELQDHLFSLPDQPGAIPYVTSYYKENWGFCLSQEKRDGLADGVYKVHIDTSLKDGVLDFGELVIPGKTDREILFSTYICHPSLANNELSGPVLAASLARLVEGLDNHFTYRFLFVPETIGSLAYIARNLGAMKSNVLAGFVLTCVGDDRAYSYIPSRLGRTVADKVALETFEYLGLDFIEYSWLDRGSDERQYCAPGIDLPVCSVTRSKYGEYPEYHTSLDKLGSVVTVEGLQGAYDYYSAVIHRLEAQRFPRVNVLGEPQLGKRDLYPSTSIKGAYDDVKKLVDVISFLDGKHSLEDIARKTNLDLDQVSGIIGTLMSEGLVSV